MIAYIYKFYCALKNKTTKRTQILSTEQIGENLDHAKMIMIRNSQKQVYESGINQLKLSKAIDAKNSLKCFYSYLDQNNLLRIGGRLANSTFNYNKIHPIIIPYGCHLMRLIIKEVHLKTYHGGNQLTLAKIRHEFRIISAKRALKTFINHCITCHRFRAKSAQQLMGQLTAGRTKIMTKVFIHTGTDLCGPIQLRMSTGRGVESQKGYIVIFICLIGEI